MTIQADGRGIAIAEGDILVISIRMFSLRPCQGSRVLSCYIRPGY